MNDQTTDAIEGLLNRSWGEYLEMPGLSLTRAQAQRLWGLDALVCRDVLDVLVQLHLLACGIDGRYRRLTEGPAPAYSRSMAKAHIDATRTRNSMDSPGPRAPRAA